MNAGDLRARLRRLRRDPAPGPARELEVELDPPSVPTEGDGNRDGTAPGSARAELPAWLRERLDRGGRAPVHRHTVGTPRDLDRAEGPAGAFAFRRTVLDAAAPHGDWRLREALAVDREALSLLAVDPVAGSIDPGRAVYLDIETTGLSGGAGTVPFLVCLGRFLDGGGFELWQGFLSGPEEEPALLDEVARRVADASGVVSFFGKSFDRHRLEDKMRVHRIDPPFESRGHLDLYHLCRRLYRPAHDPPFEDGRLQTMERGLCGVVREADLSGAHAPAAWFDFLADRPHLLEAVFTHNLLDVLSLVTLHAHLGRSLAETRERIADGGGGPLALDAASGDDAERVARSRARGLARLYERRREHEPALEWCERARRRGACERELEFLRATLLARTGDRVAALEAFRALGVAREPLAARALAEAARLAAGEEAQELLGRALALAELFDPRLAERLAQRLAKARAKGGVREGTRRTAGGSQGAGRRERSPGRGR